MASRAPGAGFTFTLPQNWGELYQFGLSAFGNAKGAISPLFEQSSGGSDSGSSNTTQTIENMAPKILLGVRTVVGLYYCPICCIAGMGAAFFQSTHPGAIEEKISQLAKTYIPLQDKKFGWLSLVVDSSENLTSVATIAFIFSSTVPLWGAGVLCGYALGTAIFSSKGT